LTSTRTEHSTILADGKFLVFCQRTDILSEAAHLQTTQGNTLPKFAKELIGKKRVD
jgi:hypothetical protein